VAESGNEDTPVPSNLPKRQRMLFMRIQNQQMQREAAAKSEEKEGEGDSDDNEETGGAKDDWYSSDDEVEDNNLTEVLKNLSSTKVNLYFFVISILFKTEFSVNMMCCSLHSANVNSVKLVNNVNFLL
jgi:hypothetical protein